jgi:diguanylate cyclase (GGDEF)-like protein
MGGEVTLDPMRQGSQRHGFSSLIVKCLSAMVIAGVALAFSALYSATRESDLVSVERQARTARHAIDISIDELALQQETVAIWDDAASHLIAPRRDYYWIHHNIGGWLHRIFGHNEVFVLDGRDQPIYAAVNGDQVSVERYRQLQERIDHLVDGVRGRGDKRAGRHDRLPGQALAKDSSVRTTDRTTHDSHIEVIGGRPAAVSAMIIKSSTPNYVRPNGKWPVLVSIRYLDGGFLDGLGAQQLIESPRFAATPETRPGEYATEILCEQGGLIGYLIWKPELPGTGIFSRLLPWTLLSLAALFAFIALLGLRLRRTVSEVAAAERQAKHLAFHDPLTQLPNRALFQRKLDELTSAATDKRKRFALALLDLDDFKLTNDTMGHDAGDALLIALSERLRNSTRDKDLVARLGGDEFALLLAGISSPEELEKAVAKLVDHIRQPCEHRGKPIECHVSIGASIYQQGNGPQEILKQADLALYEAKASGRGTYRLYEPRMWATVRSRQRMLSNAREAIEQGYIRPFYQPKVDLRTGRIVGFEALLRCCRPGQRPLGPEHLEAALEDATLAIEISQRMFEQVVEDVAGWRSEGLAFGHVAINASAAELRRGDYASRLLGRLRLAGVAPDCIQVEVTEGVLLGRGIDHVERAFKQLARAGMKLALDDFGTGFASLSHLKQFPVEIIKIDRSFVRDLQVDPGDGAIVNALVGLAAALHIEVVAEGVETEAQRSFLATLGCSTGQGFLLGKPVPAAQVPQLLRRKAREAA